MAFLLGFAGGVLFRVAFCAISFPAVVAMEETEVFWKEGLVVDWRVVARGVDDETTALVDGRAVARVVDEEVAEVVDGRAVARVVDDEAAEAVEDG